MHPIQQSKCPVVQEADIDFNVFLDLMNLGWSDQEVLKENLMNDSENLEKALYYLLKERKDKDSAGFQTSLTTSLELLCTKS